MNNIVLWCDNGLLKVSKIAELPKAFTFEGRRFEPLKFYYADVDYLRDEKKQLVGFAYTLGCTEEELILPKLVAQQSKSIKIKDGSLLLLLKDVPFEFQDVQAIGTEIYHDKKGGFIFVIPDWGFGQFAFDFASDFIPVACDPA